MTDSNGVKPSNEELQALRDVMDDLLGYSSSNDSFVYYNSGAVRRQIAYLARAELQRRQQPASVPAELVEQWYNEWHGIGPNTTDAMLQYVADEAAAYGREQAQHPQNAQIAAMLFTMLSRSPWPSADQRWAVIEAWAEKLAKEPPTC